MASIRRGHAQQQAQLYVAASQINVVVAYEDIRPEFERVIGLLDAELGDLP